MSRVALFALICLAFTAVSPGALVDGDLEAFMRGDANDSGSINATDIIYISNYLYGGGPPPPCMDQADVNDDNMLNAVDPVYLSNWLFAGGYAPPGANGDTCP